MSANLKDDDWPATAVLVSCFAEEGDRGIGDVLARDAGGERTPKWFEMIDRVFGRSCGCGERSVAWLNTRWKFEAEAKLNDV